MTVFEFASVIIGILASLAAIGSFVITLLKFLRKKRKSKHKK